MPLTTTRRHCKRGARPPAEADAAFHIASGALQGWRHQPDHSAGCAAAAAADCAGPTNSPPAAMPTRSRYSGAGGWMVEPRRCVHARCEAGSEVRADGEPAPGCPLNLTGRVLALRFNSAYKPDGFQAYRCGLRQRGGRRADHDFVFTGGNGPTVRGRIKDREIQRIDLERYGLAFTRFQIDLFPSDETLRRFSGGCGQAKINLGNFLTGALARIADRGRN